MLRKAIYISRIFIYLHNTNIFSRFNILTNFVISSKDPGIRLNFQNSMSIRVSKSFIISNPILSVRDQCNIFHLSAKMTD